MEDKDIEKLVKGVRDEVNRIEGLIPKEKGEEGSGSKEEPCPDCGGSVKSGAKYCPYCGIELEWD